MGAIFRSNIGYPTQTTRTSLASGASGGGIGSENNGFNNDRGPQLQTTEGVPTTAIDSDKWNLPITSLAETDIPWQPKYPDYIWKLPTVALLLMSTVQGGINPIPASASAIYRNTVPAAKRAAEYPAFFYVPEPTAIVTPLSWKPVYDDFARAPLRTAEYPPFFYVPEPTAIVVPLSWHPTYDNFTRREQPVTEFPPFAYVPEPTAIVTPLSWKPVYDDFARKAQCAADYPAFFYGPAPIVPALSWRGVYPDYLFGPGRVPEYQAFFAPIESTPYTGDRGMAIHAPDETPQLQPVRISVEYVVGGVAVPFTGLPQIRLYYLDATGAQVTEVALTNMTQYGVNPSYYYDWNSPQLEETYMIEILGVYLALVVQELRAISVRPEYDPQGLAIDDVLVSRM